MRFLSLSLCSFSHLADANARFFVFVVLVVIVLAVAAGVKVYFPSEWGSDLEISPYSSPLLDRKTKHVEEAREAGLKTVIFVIGLFSELILSPVFGTFWYHLIMIDPPPPPFPTRCEQENDVLCLCIYLGFWTPPNTLNIPDVGSHRVAFTSKNHIVQYALRAVILAFQDPKNFPDKIRVWDEDG